MSVSFDPGKLDEIKTLAASGNKILAIKLYREATGVGLAEAKEAVEALVGGQRMTFPHLAIPAIPMDIDATLEARIRHLLAARQKIEAIKIYRERTQVGLKEAKDAVDAIEAQMLNGSISRGTLPMDTSNIDPFAEQPGQSSRLVVILLALIVLALGVAFYGFFLRGG